MKKRFNLFLSSCMLIAISNAANAKVVGKQHVDYFMINQSIVEKIILPDYLELLKSSINLDKTLKHSCKHNGLINQDEKKEVIISNRLLRNFLNLRLSWAKVQLISFGPISFLERRERFNFWPDKHRVGERQIRRLLNKSEQEELGELSIERFREKSVAVQGLGAMEHILFSHKKRLNARDCQLAKLISANLLSIAEEVSNQWSNKPIEFKNDLLSPTLDLTFFSNPKEVTSVLLNDMSTQVRVVSDLKIANALPNVKKRHKKISYRKLESWRTMSSFRLMHVNILSVMNYYQVGFSKQMKQFNLRLHQKIIKQFEHVLEQLNTFNLIKSANFKKRIEHPEILEGLSSLQSELLKLDQFLKQDIVKAFALSLKFNALDGD